MDDKLLTPEQVAEILATKMATLELWRRKGKGPQWIKLVRQVRYRASDVQSFIEDSVLRK